MFSQKPKLAEKFAKKTKDFSKLPETATKELNPDYMKPPLKMNLADSFDERRASIHKSSKKDPDAAINALIDINVEEHGSKKEKKMLGMLETAAVLPSVYKATGKPKKPDFNKAENRKIAKEFAEDVPMKVHIASSVMSDSLFKEGLLKKKPETAERFVRKDWSEKKGKFDYIYPSDIERQGRKTAKESLRASEKGEIPKSLRLSNIVKGAAKESVEHPWADIDIAKRIAKDHLKEDPKAYKMETADIFTPEGKGKKEGDYKGGKKGRTWNWDDHKYRARVGPKGEYKYNYTQQGNVPAEESLAQRKQKREEETNINDQLTQQQRQQASFQRQQQSPTQRKAVSRSNVNITNAVKGFPSKKGTVSAKIMPGAGLHVQTQGIGNPVNTGLNMVPAKQAIKGVIQNTMVDQAKAQGNIYDTRAIGQEDFNKQDSSLNPLSPNNLTPEQQQRHGQCHEMAKQMAMKTGGVRHTTIGRNAGFHSITLNPDSTVYDYVLGINNMPINRYLSLVPYSFAANP